LILTKQNQLHPKIEQPNLDLAPKFRVELA